MRAAIRACSLMALVDAIALIAAHVRQRCRRRCPVCRRPISTPEFRNRSSKTVGNDGKSDCNGSKRGLFRRAVLHQSEQQPESAERGADHRHDPEESSHENSIPIKFVASRAQLRHPVVLSDDGDVASGLAELHSLLNLPPE